MSFVQPKVFLIGYTSVDLTELIHYLEYTKQTEFLSDWHAAKDAGLSDMECLCSFYAKICYRSLCLGHNDNLSKIRSIPDNVKSIIDTAHGSVFEHCNINFIATDVSRVLTHEIVRHRAGWAYSQTSGRYVRSDKIDFVLDPILGPIAHDVHDFLLFMEIKYAEWIQMMGLNDPGMNFDKKKKITSALRRMLPNGQANEIGFSVNIRALRHFVMMRTGRAAEWEIRDVAAQVYQLVKAKYPLLFSDAKEEIVNGIIEVTGMKMQPY